VNTFNDAPEAPVISSPAIGSEVPLQELDLVVENAFDLDWDVLTYFFELDSVETFDSAAKQTSGEISEGTDTTSWHVTGLDDNTTFYWRALASDGYADSPWALGNFFVNTVNDAPSVPTVKNPGDGSWVDTLTPKLELNPSGDPDHDTLTYEFELYADAGLTQFLAAAQSDIPEWVISPELTDNTWYHWRAQAEDVHGVVSGWMNAASFFTDSNGVDDPPTITIQAPSGDVFTNADSFSIHWEDTDPDSNADIALYFDTDQAGEDGLLIVEGLKEDPDGDDDSYLWDITSLPEGSYYIYATITDGTSTETVYSAGSVTIDRTPPALACTPAGGTYGPGQSVTLTTHEPADIYCTLDGTEPTTDSILYSSPIDITETTMLKAMAIDAAGNQCGTVTETYSIGGGEGPQDVTDMVAIAQSRMSFDRRTGKVSVTVTVTNTAAASIGSPLWLVVESITPDSVTLAAFDGTTAEGKPYFDHHPPTRRQRPCSR